MIQINGRTVFNNSDLNNPDIDGGAIDGTAIGANSASTGAFTTLSASGAVNTAPLNWTAVPAANFTATPASTSTITMGVDMTGTILARYPLKYVIGGTTYYGIVSTIAAGLLTVNGAPLGGDVTALYYGNPERVYQIQFGVPAVYEDATDTDLIGSDLHTKLIWDKPKAYLVCYRAYSETADSSSDGKATVQINNTEVNTSAGGLTIAAAATWYSTVVDIATAAYDVNPGEEVEIAVTKGTGGDATYLTMKMLFVLP